MRVDFQRLHPVARVEHGHDIHQRAYRIYRNSVDHGGFSSIDLRQNQVADFVGARVAALFQRRTDALTVLAHRGIGQDPIGVARVLFRRGGNS